MDEHSSDTDVSDISTESDPNNTIPYELDEEINFEDVCTTSSASTSFASGWRKSNIHCCWGECKADTRLLDKISPNTIFIPFPKPGKIKEGMTAWEKNRELERTAKAKRWVQACGRKDFTLDKIKSWTYICSQHFINPNGPTDQFPDPVKATLKEEELVKIKNPKRRAPKQRSTPVKIRRKSNNIPVVHVDDSDHLTDNSDLKRNDMDELPFEEFQQEDNISDGDGNVGEIDCDYVNSSPDYTEINCDFSIKRFKEQATQTIYEKYLLGAKVETIIARNSLVVQKNSSLDKYGNMSMEQIFKSDEKCKYFIGLYPKEFSALFEWLGPAKDHLASNSSFVKKFSIAEEIFITLIRLRRGLNIYTLAHIYDCSTSHMSNIFKKWIMFLFHHFKQYRFLMFPDRHAMKEHNPAIFRKFKNIRASIDCTAFRCQVPRDYAKQGNMYSSYKHHTTMKCLIAVNPCGAACFISDLYEGTVDDYDIFQRCGILDHVNPGDSFLVDKGFRVQDLLLPKQATIYIPPFLGQRSHFTKEELIMTKRIAKARIHVERFNERLKKFRLLDRVIPLNLCPLASQLVYVASCLVNFQPRLCK